MKKKVWGLIIAPTLTLTAAAVPLVTISVKANQDSKPLLFEKQEYQNEVIHYQEVDLGNQHSGAIVTDEAGNDHLSMWGYNYYGQVGNGSTNNQLRPIAISLPESSIKTLSLGYDHSGAVTTDAQGNDHLYMWGRNDYGQVGNGNRSNQLRPIAISLPENSIKTLALGNYHSGAVTTDAQGNDHLYMWGSNGDGKLGNGNTSSQLRPIAISLPENSIKTLALGVEHSGAVTTDAQGNDHLYMWGRNYEGQIGNGNTSNQLRPIAISLPENSIKTLALGNYHSGAITTDQYGYDHLYMWGYNENGQVGNGNTSNQLRPTEITLFETQIKALALGVNHTGVITNYHGDDRLYMWGYNANGQLGDGTTQNHSVPKEIGLPEENFDQLVLGRYHSSALTHDQAGNNHLYMWGSSDYGQHGDGTTTRKKRPVEVSKIVEAQDLKTLKVNKMQTRSSAVTLDLALSYRDLNWIQVNRINSENLTIEVPNYQNINAKWTKLNNDNQVLGQLVISNLRSNNIYSDLTINIKHKLSNSSLTINIPPFITLP